MRFNSPYAVVQAGLAALQGTKHGGHTHRVEALFQEIGKINHIKNTLVNRLKQGADMPGFGHRLYPNGDPRAKVLFELLLTHYANHPSVNFATHIAQEIFNLTGDYPTIDFALVTLAKTLNLPPGSPLALFALGRTIGWLGHAIEQYKTGRIIRPRAQYTGKQPTADR